MTTPPDRALPDPAVPDRALPDATLRYADHPEAVLDVHLPATGPTTGSSATGTSTGTSTGPARVLVLLHGGFWKAEWDRRHTRAMARTLSEDGWVVVTPEYRRVRGGGGWPVTGEDVAAALAATPRLLADLGVTVGRLVVTGHSAGGHLALWLAATAEGIDRVVALAPVCDLGEAIRLHLGDGATTALLGEQDPAVADPMVLLAHRTTEATHVVVVHGVDDDVVPLSLSRGLVERHPWVDLREVPGGHFEVIEPGSEAFAVVRDALA